MALLRHLAGGDGGDLGSDEGERERKMATGAASNGKVAPAGPPLLRQALARYHHERSIDLKPKSYRGRRPNVQTSV